MLGLQEHFTVRRTH